MLTIESDRILMVDIDFTLLSPDTHLYPHLPCVEVTRTMFSGSTGAPITRVFKHAINEANVATLKNLVQQGYTAIAWSKCGYRWTIDAITALGLENIISLCMSKPEKYLDDKICTDWMGQKIWKDWDYARKD